MTNTAIDSWRIVIYTLPRLNNVIEDNRNINNPPIDLDTVTTPTALACSALLNNLLTDIVVETSYNA